MGIKTHTLDKRGVGGSSSEKPPHHMGIKTY